MSNVATVPANVPSVIADMAARFGMDKRAFESTLKATVVPASVSNEQFVAFLLVAKEYNLNPLTKEIYAFPAKGGGIQPIVSIDGWCNIINSHPQLDGIEFEDITKDGKLTAIACKLYRKDRSKPIIAIEYMDECKGTSDPWKRWPARMLRHKALIQCARYAFGFSGIVDPDEADRMKDVSTVTHEPNVIDNINAQIVASKTLSKEHVDPETGEVTEHAGDSSPPTEIKPTEPKAPDLPTFDINAYALDTQAGVKEAAAAFLTILQAYPTEDRPGVFLGSSGVMLVDAMRAHGLALDVKKIEALGVKLPPTEEKVPGFIGKKEAAA